MIFLEESSQPKMMSTERALNTSSPFRQSEWDSRLDHLLQDLENSTTCAQNSHQVRSHSTERKYASVQKLQKSQSTSSLGAGGEQTSTMLKDLDQALKASTNYIESHRTLNMPNGTQEYHHEYRSSTSNNSGPSDFNLERQVIKKKNWKKARKNRRLFL